MVEFEYGPFLNRLETYNQIFVIGHDISSFDRIIWNSIQEINKNIENPSEDLSILLEFLLYSCFIRLSDEEVVLKFRKGKE